MLVLVLALIGGFVGFTSLGWSTGGFVAGAAIGALAGWSSELRNRVVKLERRLSRVEKSERPMAAPAPEPEQAAYDAMPPDAIPDNASRGRAWPEPEPAPRAQPPSPLPAATAPAAAQLR